MLEDSTMGLSTIGLLVIFALGTVWPPLAAASPKKVPTIGVLAFASPPSEPDWKQSSVFLQELRHLGYVEGQNIRFEWRFADQRVDRLRDLAGELVRLKVDVIVAATEPATSETQHATTTIPIVMAGVNDPVALGFVKSLAHPGGNITGVTALGQELVGKQLELLKAAVPEVTKIGVHGTPGNLARFWPEVERTAQALDVQLQVGGPVAYGQKTAVRRLFVYRRSGRSLRRDRAVSTSK